MTEQGTVEQPAVIAPRHETALMNEGANISNVMQRIMLIQDVMKKVMKVDTHYGTIKGTNKPTLLKAGAEVLATTFQLCPKVEVIAQRDAEAIRFSCKVQLLATNGIFLGEGVGEASTGEDKYKWRKAVSTEEYQATPEDRKRIAYKSSDHGSYTVNQVRQNPDDQANTVLKMAKKRAFIDAILTVTGASDIFTQDVEDMDLQQPTSEAPAPEEGKAKEPEKVESATVKQVAWIEKNCERVWKPIQLTEWLAEHKYKKITDVSKTDASALIDTLMKLHDAKEK